MFRVVLYEVHTASNFGGPPLYFDMQQHRDAILEGVVVARYLKTLLRSRYNRPVAFQCVPSQIVQPNISVHYAVRFTCIDLGQGRFVWPGLSLPCEFRVVLCEGISTK